MPRRPTPLLRTALTALGLIVVSAVLARPGLVDARTGAVPVDTTLILPPAFVWFSPLWATLDSLSLLALSQHIALLLGVLFLFLVYRWFHRPRGRTWGRSLLTEAGAAVGCLLGLVAVYAVMTYVPRPVPRLEVSNPDLLVLDFHSHSRHSHDVGERYPVDWNRRVHERTGFHAAYLTDHAGWEGLADAAVVNPATAGDGFVLLAGSELWLGGENTLALGDSSVYRQNLDERRIGLEPGRGPIPRDPPATLILALPARRPHEAVGFGPTEPWGLVGLEISDASPKGLEQGRRQRQRLLRVADRQDLAIVSGSNNHGAGQSAAAWTLIELPGWRSLSPEELGRALEVKLHRDRGNATRVVERVLPFPTRYALVSLTVVTWPWHVLTSLSLTERLVWLLYAVGLGVVGWRRTRPSTGPRAPLSG